MRNYLNKKIKTLHLEIRKRESNIKELRSILYKKEILPSEMDFEIKFFIESEYEELKNLIKKLGFVYEKQNLIFESIKENEGEFL